MDETTVMRQALGAYAARPLPGRGSLSGHREPPAGAAAAGVFLFVTLAVLGFVVLLANAGRVGTPAAPCGAIPYAVDDAAPAHVVREFEAAMAEVHQRSGLRFTPADNERARLTVEWRTRLQINSRPLRSSTEGSRKNFIGSAIARWTADRAPRRLVSASIELDATRTWPVGWSRGDSLRSVLVHEIGHVIGLDHNGEPTSFMFPETSLEQPRWTAADLARLAEAGRESGCSPPTT